MHHSRVQHIDCPLAQPCPSKNVWIGMCFIWALLENWENENNRNGERFLLADNCLLCLLKCKWSISDKMEYISLKLLILNEMIFICAKIADECNDAGWKVTNNGIVTHR